MLSTTSCQAGLQGRGSSTHSFEAPTPLLCPPVSDRSLRVVLKNSRTLRSSVLKKQRLQAAQSVSASPSFTTTLSATTLVASPTTTTTSNNFLGGQPKKWDVLGLGQAMVDYSASVDDHVLSLFDVPKGGRRVITVEERGAVMQTLDDYGCASQVSPGGSLANSLVAISRLARISSRGLRVAMAGSVGNDTLGQFFQSQMQRSGVDIVTEDAFAGLSMDEDPQSIGAQALDALGNETNGHTGTVMVLTTADAQRSFLSFFTSEQLRIRPALESAIRQSRCIVIEGYLLEMAGAVPYLSNVVRLAKACGAMVVMTAGDAGVVARHSNEIREIVSLGVDVLFMNAEEARQMLVADASSHTSASSQHGLSALGATDLGERLQGLCPVTVITDGSKGAYLRGRMQAAFVPPHWAKDGPVDTCGAGDAFAAGVLYGLLNGCDLRSSGEFGAKVASAVISRYGPQLTEADACALAPQLPLLESMLALSFQ